jgi:hypothetical protein
MSDANSSYDYDQNFLLGLSYLEAFLKDDDEKADLIQSQIPDDLFSSSALQVNIVLLSRLSELEGIPAEEILAGIRANFLLNH